MSPGRAGAAPDREAVERFGQARWVVAALWPFMTRAVMRLCPRWSEDVPAVAVDGEWRLYLNPDWVKKQHQSTLALILVGHELQHALGSHSVRLTEYRDVWIASGGMQTTVANAAHDLAINSGLAAFVDSAVKYQRAVGRSPAIPVSLPKEALYPEKFTDKRGKPFPSGLMSEQYAQLLISEASQVMMCGAPDKGSGGGKPTKPLCGRCGSGGGGEVEEFEEKGKANPDDPASGVSDVERDVIRQHTAQAIREQAAKHAGSVPGHMQLWADIYLTPSRVPWDRLLNREVRAAMNWLAGQGDYSYKVRSKRQQGSRVIMPGLYRPKPKFLVALDTSGSMTKKDYSTAFGHIVSILRSIGIHQVPVFTCDTRASDIQMVSDIRQIEMVGGGGTDMAAAIAKAAEAGYKLLVVLTDGYTGWGSPVPGVKVVACLTRKPPAMPPDWVTTVVQDAE